jgi:hypothetical protein
MRATIDLLRAHRKVEVVKVAGTEVDVGGA